MKMIVPSPMVILVMVMMITRIESTQVNINGVMYFYDPDHHSVSYDIAKTYCEQLGGQLTTQTDFKNLNQLYRQVPFHSFWMGGYASSNQTSPVSIDWIDGGSSRVIITRGLPQGGISSRSDSNLAVYRYMSEMLFELNDNNERSRPVCRSNVSIDPSPKVISIYEPKSEVHVWSEDMLANIKGSNLIIDWSQIKFGEIPVCKSLLKLKHEEAKERTSTINSAAGHSVTKMWSEGRISSFDSKQFILPITLWDKNHSDAPSVAPSFGQDVDEVVEYLTPLVANGLKSVLLTPYIPNQDINTTVNPLIQVIPSLVSSFPGLFIIVDVSLDPFDVTQLNATAMDAFVPFLSTTYAQLGAHAIAPSYMKDGKLEQLRHVLNSEKYQTVSIMGNSVRFDSKFNSQSNETSNRSKMLLPGASGLAMRSATRDIEEGADSVIISPGLMYLDVIQRMKILNPNNPIVVHQSMGEYAMLSHASDAGAFDLKEAVMETMVSFQRAGATAIITPFTPIILEVINKEL